MHESWQTFLKSEFEKDYFCRLSTFLHEAYANSQVFPAKQQVFRAFTTDLSDIKVVILGQDPYHTPGAAHGLAFSVPSSQPIPPSLINIYREIDSEYGSHANQDGNLKSWQQQGVLLLNNVLTVEAHKAGSHRNKGWEIFTEAVIRHLSDRCDNLVFLLYYNKPLLQIVCITFEAHFAFFLLPVAYCFRYTSLYNHLIIIFHHFLSFFIVIKW